MENLKKAVDVLIKTTMKVDDAVEDKKVSLAEGFGITLSAVAFIGVFKNLPAIKTELENWTDEKTAELNAYFQQELDLNNDATEFLVEQAVEILLRFVTMVFVKK